MSMKISYPDFARSQKCGRRFWLMHHEGQAQKPSDIACYYQAQHQQLLDRYLKGLDGGYVKAGAGDFRQFLVSQEGAAEASGRLNIIGANVEGNFETDIGAIQYQAHIELLKRDSAGRWSFVMVKAASGIKDRYLEEAAFQLYVLNMAGFDVSDCRIVCANKRYVKGENSSPFLERSVYKQLVQRQAAIANQLREIEALLARSSCPDACLQRNCIKPFTCRYYHQCWPELSEYNVLSIPYMSPVARDGLIQRGLVEIADLANDKELLSTLSDKQRHYIELVKNETHKIDNEAIAQLMEVLEYPLYFLDFEADNPALPKLAGQRAFMKIPFQFSCHCLMEKGELSHYDYLHNNKDDPRPVLIENLLKSIGEKGSVIVWHADFERSRLHELAKLMPEHKEKLLAIAARLWDMELIFKHHYHDYRFKGSCSVKAIIKALLPDLSYDDLRINDGEQVVAVWNCMLEENDKSQRQEIFDNIRAYCERDTLAMVALFGVLEGVCLPGPS